MPRLRKTAPKPLTLDDVEIEIRVEVDLTPVEGNAMASGDAAADRAVEKAIRARLARGETHAWCTILVTARYGTLEGYDSLGAVSVTDESDLEETIASHEMRETALAALESSRQLRIV
jgi:hypothetical protein